MTRAAPVFVLFLVWLLASTAAAASLFVRASGTELKAKAGPGGTALAKLDIGTRCEVVAKEGNWVKVTVTMPDKKEKTGYVFAPKLSDDRPDKERFGGPKVAANAAENDTALALRGLSATSEKYAERDTAIKPADVAAVKKMEQRKPPKEELERFLREGKLGEYMQ